MPSNEALIKAVQQKHAGMTLDPDDPLLVDNTVSQLVQEDFVQRIMASRPALSAAETARIARCILDEVNKVQLRQIEWIRLGIVVAAATAGLGLFVAGGLLGYRYGAATASPLPPSVTNCKASPQPDGEAFSCLFWTRPPAATKGTPGVH